MCANDLESRMISNNMTFSREKLLVSPFQIDDADNLFNFDIALCIQSNESILSEFSESLLFSFPTFSKHRCGIPTSKYFRGDDRAADFDMDVAQYPLLRTNRYFPSELTGNEVLLQKMLEGTSPATTKCPKALDIKLLMTGEEFTRTPTMSTHRNLSDAQPFLSSSSFPHSTSLPVSDNSPAVPAALPDAITIRPSSARGPLRVRADASCAGALPSPASPSPSCGARFFAADGAPGVGLRRALCHGTKSAFLDLTRNSLDDFIELALVGTAWIPPDVLLHALCLVNRLTGRYPGWHTRPLAEPGAARIHWTGSTSLRCFLAVLMLSSKFHGDTIYDAASVCEVVDRVRSYQVERGRRAAREPPAGGVYLRLRPARLNLCEQRVFQALGCAVWVTPSEFNACCAHVEALGRDKLWVA